MTLVSSPQIARTWLTWILRLARRGNLTPSDSEKLSLGNEHTFAEMSDESMRVVSCACRPQVRSDPVSFGAPPVDPPGQSTVRPGVTVLSRVGDLATTFLPTSPISARQREVLLAQACEAEGAERIGQLHRWWAAFLGGQVDGDLTEGWRTHVGAAISNGYDDVAVNVIRAVESTIAIGMLAGRFERAVERLMNPRMRLGFTSPRALLSRSSDVAAVAVGLPIVASLSVWCAALEVGNRMVGPLPEVRCVGSQDDLFTQLVAAAMPNVLASTPARAVVKYLPVSLALGLVDGTQVVTVRAGRGAVSVESGIAEDVVAVLDGDFDAVVDAAGDVLVRELWSALYP